MIRQIFIVFFKELKCVFRDKRSFFISLIFPLLLVPTMLMVFDISRKSSQNLAEKNIAIGISDKNNSFYTFLSAQKNIKIIDVADKKMALNSEQIAAYFEIGNNFDKKIIEQKIFDMKTEINKSSANLLILIPVINHYEEAYMKIIEYKWMEKITTEELNAAVNVEWPYESENNSINYDFSSLYFNLMIPMMLIMYCCIGSANIACDITVGEKERGTLESLLSTGANRMAIILGKLLTTTVMGVTSGLCTVLGLWGYIFVSSSNSSIKLTELEVFLLLLLIFLTAMFFATINLTIGIFSKSFKEAQIYMVPLSMFSLVPTYFTHSMSLSSINLTHFCIPILNIVCAIKEIFAGVINFAHLGLVFAWVTFYIALAFFAVIKMFKKETVLFRI